MEIGILLALIVYPIFWLSINLLRSANKPSEISIDEFAILNKYLLIFIDIFSSNYIKTGGNNDKQTYKRPKIKKIIKEIIAQNNIRNYLNITKRC